MTSIVSVTFFNLTTAATIATSLVHSGLEYCNTLYHGLPLTQIKRLQQIENTLPRAVTRTLSIPI